VLPILLEQGTLDVATSLPPTKDTATAAQLFDAWEEHIDGHERLSPAAKRDLTCRVRKYVVDEPTIAHVPVARLGSSVVLAWMGRVAKGKAPYTSRNIVAGFRRFIDDAIKHEWTALQANPLRNPSIVSELPTAAPLAGAGVIVHLQAADAAKLLRCSRVPLDRRVLYAVALTSALRAGELRGLRWADVENDGADVPLVRVRRSLALIGPEGFASFKGPKTANGYRVVPLHPLARAALARWKGDAWEAWTTRAPTDADLVFPNAKGEPWRPDDADLLRLDLAEAGCPTTFEAPDGTAHELTFQALRRSCASYLAAADVPGEVIGQVLGHAGKTTAAKHYTAKNLARLARAIERIDLDVDPGVFDGGRGGNARFLRPATPGRPAIVLDEDGLPSVPEWGECPTAFAPPWDYDTWCTVGIARFIRHMRGEDDAPPARIGLATFGLGNRCSIH
jgi:integrase